MEALIHIVVAPRDNLWVEEKGQCLGQLSLS